jgi:hypothetical protein
VPEISDLIGKDGVLEQMFLWQTVSQVVAALAGPAFTVLAQDVNQQHPVIGLDPAVQAQAVVRGLTDAATARAEAEREGTSADHFALLTQLAKVRIPPADLATAVLRSYMTQAEAVAEAKPQGVDAADLAVLADLAGEAPGADQLAQALRRKIIPAKGTGPGSVSFEQGISETRLHNKWGPVLDSLSAEILSPADAASAVVRNFLSNNEGTAAAGQSGVSTEDFRILTQLSGDAPAPQQLAEALRRGVIDETGTGAESVSFAQGIAEGRLADKWAGVIKSLARQWPTPVTALNALLKGQLSDADAAALYEKLGGDPQFFSLLFDVEGNSPTPAELVQMANRGIIPWDGTGAGTVSYEQGFKEGPWRDKWAGPYRDVAKYVPPPGTIVTMLAHGALSEADAAAELAKQGMSETIIAAYIDQAHTEALSAYRGLSVSAAIDAYRAQLLTADATVSILEALHVGPQAAGLMIAYADIQRSFTAVTNAVSRVRTLFTARKITQATAHDALAALGIPAESLQGMIATWTLENAISVKTLTETQIVDAWDVGALDAAECMTELGNIGYTPLDAWILMCNKAKAVLPDKPDMGPAAPQGYPIPGTT